MAIDFTPVTDKIYSAGIAVAAIGMAVLLVVVAYKTFMWIRQGSLDAHANSCEGNYEQGYEDGEAEFQEVVNNEAYEEGFADGYDGVKSQV